MHFFLFKVSKNCQNLLYDHPIKYDQKQHITSAFYQIFQSKVQYPDAEKLSHKRYLPNAFLCHFQRQWLSLCALDILTKFFKRYVDDVCIMFHCQSHLNDFVNYMNTKHPNVKFTSAFAKNDYFSFLDARITRNNNQLVSSVFRNFRSCFSCHIQILFRLHFNSSFLFLLFFICKIS